MSPYEEMKFKVRVYERLLHTLQLYYEVTMESEKVKHLLDLISAWSYAHRSGNGELSEEEQQQRIDHAFDEITKAVQLHNSLANWTNDHKY